MVKIFDGECSFSATRKYRGEEAPFQYEAAEKWAAAFGSRVGPIESQAADLPERLRALRRQGNLALVVGAGVSISCGLPSWPTLVRGTAAAILANRRLAAREVNSVLDFMPFADNLLALSQAVTALTTESEVASTVASLLYARDPRSSSLLDAVVGLTAASFASNQPLGKNTLVLTFNYDTLIEQELAKRHVPVNSLGRAASLREVTSDVVAIVHLHGVSAPKGQAPSKIVLTEASYGDAYLRSPGNDPLTDIMELGLTPLFVGFSFTDHFVRRLLQQLFIASSKPVAVGLLADRDLLPPGKVETASAWELGYSPNDQVGWRKANLDPTKFRPAVLRKLPAWFARWGLFSIGVEWYRVGKWADLPGALAAVAE
jgi:hypothetical protein